MNPLTPLNDYGQVIWLDFLSRRSITDGRLKRIINGDPGRSDPTLEVVGDSFFIERPADRGRIVEYLSERERDSNP